MRIPWLSRLFRSKQEDVRSPYTSPTGFFIIPEVYHGWEANTQMEVRDRKCMELAINHTLVNAILNTRQAQASIFGDIAENSYVPGWTLETPGEQELEGRYAQQRLDLMAFLNSCGMKLTDFIPTQTSFSDFVAACVRSLLVYNKIFIRIWKLEDQLAFGVVNPAGVVYRPEQYVPRRVENCSLVRYRGGMPVEEYEPSDGILYVRRISTEYAYPPSETWQALELLNGFRYILFHNISRFELDRLPRGILALVGATTQEFANLREEMINVKTGPTRRKEGERAQYPSVMIYKLPQGSDMKWVPMDPTAKEMDYPGAFQWLIGQVCAIFGIDPEELGLASTAGGPVLSESSPKDAVMLSKEKGLYPLLVHVSAAINMLLNMIVENNPFIFSFTGLKGSRVDILRMMEQVEFGFMSPRTVYAVMNRPISVMEDSPLWDVPVLPSTWLPYLVQAMLGVQPQDASRDEHGGSRPTPSSKRAKSDKNREDKTQ